jgi:glutathione synthase/RimK-type ligase-like ATP-grasp enzyme
MKIAIHHSEWSFSVRWIEYCTTNNVPFKIVNCYDTNIIDQLEDCDALMWHYHQLDYRDMLFAKGLLLSLEHSGKTVFPNFNTAWHFDDKVGQKYLFEAIGAPFVKSYVFYDKKTATEWAKGTAYPKVFKLSGGAGSTNVSLVKSYSECENLINKAFVKGFSQYNAIFGFKERVKVYKRTKDYKEILKGIVRFFIPPEFATMHGREKGYIYFQDFIPNNTFDIRVVVIGDKAFAIKRMTRKNDFRASGSGVLIYDKSEIDTRCVKISFEVNEKIKSQSIAYDYVFDEFNNPLIVEISYGFDVKPYDLCPGYWTKDLNWHEGVFNPQAWMIEELIDNIAK